MMLFRYKLIMWLAQGDLILLNVFIDNIDVGTSRCELKFKYRSTQGAFFANCYLIQGGNFFDPSEPFDQPLWAWWTRRGE